MSGRRRLILLALCWGCCLPALGQRVWIAPDVPTQIDPATPLPWQAVEYDAPRYSTTFELPAEAGIDALHKLDAPGSWLFSLAAVGSTTPALGIESEARDVLRRNDDGSFVPFFCGGAVPDALPPESSVDAVMLDGGDAGDLILSTDIGVELPPGSGSWHEPSDLLRYTRTAAGCGGWSFAGPALDASAIGGGIPSTRNVVGAALDGTTWLLLLDTPEQLTPNPEPRFFVPGDVVAWDGVAFKLRQQLGGWPQTSRPNALSCQAGPGRTVDLRIGKAETTVALRLHWSGSCSSGAEDYGIYEGRLSDMTSHTAIDCFDDLGDLEEEIQSDVDASTYYLVVPKNSVEGSYGTSQDQGVLTERPVGVSRCVPEQRFTSCP